MLRSFTALEEGGEALDSDAWAMDVYEHIPSEDIKVNWQVLHVIDEAPDQLPFLKYIKTCAITSTQTQRISFAWKRETLLNCN